MFIKALSLLIFILPLLGCPGKRSNNKPIDHGQSTVTKVAKTPSTFGLEYQSYMDFEFHLDQIYAHRPLFKAGYYKPYELEGNFLEQHDEFGFRKRDSDGRVAASRLVAFFPKETLTAKLITLLKDPKFLEQLFINDKITVEQGQLKIFKKTKFDGDDFEVSYDLGHEFKELPTKESKHTEYILKLRLQQTVKTQVEVIGTGQLKFSPSDEGLLITCVQMVYFHENNLPKDMAGQFANAPDFVAAPKFRALMEYESFRLATSLSKIFKEKRKRAKEIGPPKDLK